LKYGIKEDITTLRSFLNYIIASFIGVVAGTINFYMNEDFNFIFVTGIIATILLLISFGVVKMYLYRKIKQLKEIE
jgi:putative effector of murein hydrolase LrgA (UPF0299 family)